VLFTANDAYMRDFQLFVPADCVCSNTPEENDFALKQMEKILKVNTTISHELNLEKMQTREK
jgi:nicotinamidase-related amidase